MISRAIGLTIFLAVLQSTCHAADSNTLSIQLEKGIFAEESEGDYSKAIGIFEEIVEDASANRAIVAEAIYRLGLCYLRESEEKAGLAREQFQHLTRHYSEITEFSEKARRALNRMDSPPKTTGPFGGIFEQTPGALGGVEGYGGGFGVRPNDGMGMVGAFGGLNQPGGMGLGHGIIEDASTELYFERVEQLPTMYALIEKAKTGSESVREEILQRASERILSSTYPVKTRWMSCYVLSGSSIQEGIPVLDKALTGDPDTTVRGVAACALGAFPPDHVRPILKEALDRETLDEVENWIIKSLSGEFFRPDRVRPGSIDLRVSDEDLTSSLYPEGGLYRVTVRIRNDSQFPFPPFEFHFYRGEPDRGGELLHGAVNGAGPIQPGETWYGSCSPFVVTKDGQEIVVVLDPENRIAETDESNNRARILVQVDPGHAALDRISVKEEWIDKLVSVQDHNPMAFLLGPQLVELDPDLAYEIAAEVWDRLANDKVKTGVLKTFAFSRHKRVLDVLHLGAADESMEVRNYALEYLKNYAFRDFTEDLPAYDPWREQFQGKDNLTVIRANARWFVDQLAEAEKGKTRADLASLMRDLDLGGGTNKTTFPEKREYLIDAGILNVIGKWLNDPTSEEVLDDLFASIRSLSPPDDWTREVIYPLIFSDIDRERRNAIGYLGATGKDWAVNPLLQQLLEAEDRTEIWTLAMALGDLGDPKVIPPMIAVIEADNTYDTVYGVGYFGLGRITGVEYDEAHDGSWWRDWWEKNRDHLHEEVGMMEIPNLPVKKQGPCEGFKWFVAGNKPTSYRQEKVIDEDGGCATLFQSVEEVNDGFGTAMVEIPPDEYSEKRVRLSTSIRTEDVAMWAAMWMRVDGEGGEILAFDNMEDRPIVGTTGEEVYEIVLDVPEGSVKIAYGVLLAGTGKVWIGTPKIEAVSKEQIEVTESKAGER